MKVTIDPALCEGRKRCFNLYTELFKEGPDGKGLVLATGEPGGELVTEDQIVDAGSAANACPVGAIKVEY